MLIHDIMSEEVASVDVSTDLRTAVIRMLKRDIGSVIVEKNETPTGICTKTDALLTAAKMNVPLSEIPITKAMTEDVVTASPDMPIRKAIRTMNEYDIKRLPVVRDFDVIGIVTDSDIVHNHSSLVKEIHRAEEGRSRWSSD